VVECCFANGWVKLLFATETFAMGVNMPARTVVFDSIRKHDGKQFRTLLPAEYIQMAGRAGRRGLDSTGTVIIMCKNEVFDLNELHGMIQGRPTRLESKFRLTHSMILNLLRVEELRVEDMMKRSFAELDTQKKQASYKERLQELKKELASLPDIGGTQYQDIAAYYQLASQYLDIRSRIWSLLLGHPVPSKAFTPGRIVIINYRGQTNVPALILAVDTKTRLRSFSVLVLCGTQLPASLSALSLKDSPAAKSLAPSASLSGSSSEGDLPGGRDQQRARRHPDPRGGHPPHHRPHRPD